MAIGEEKLKTNQGIDSECISSCNMKIQVTGVPDNGERKNGEIKIIIKTIPKTFTKLQDTSLQHLKPLKVPRTISDKITIPGNIILQF